MGQLRIMNESGDKTLTWEPGTADAETVRLEFEAIMANSADMAFAFTRDNPVPTMTREFDETATKIVVTPRVAGG